MLRLPEAWVWDFWLVDDGQKYHAFFLYASRAVGEPDARHHRASVGHAVSDDLRNWQRVGDALVHGDAPAFDETATWTGSVVRHPDGRWFMFYTGARALNATANIQTIGCATSHDLTTWTKNPHNPVLSNDGEWYEKLTDGVWHDEAFRDPWVMPDPSGQGWHMLITARANHGEAFDRGVVGHATSADLEHWTLHPPLSDPGQGFAQLEVMQYVEVDHRRLLLFSCLAKDASPELRATGTTGGVWVADAEGPLGPYDLRRAHQITDSSQYVGRLMQDRDTSEWLLLTFANDHHDGSFVGELLDPVVFHPPAPAKGSTWSTLYTSPAGDEASASYDSAT